MLSSLFSKLLGVSTNYPPDSRRRAQVIRAICLLGVAIGPIRIGNFLMLGHVGDAVVALVAVCMCVFVLVRLKGGKPFTTPAVLLVATLFVATLLLSAHRGGLAPRRWPSMGL